MENSDIAMKICILIVLAPAIISILILSGSIILLPLGLVTVKFIVDALGIVLAGVFVTLLLGFVAYVVCSVLSL